MKNRNTKIPNTETVVCKEQNKKLKQSVCKCKVINYNKNSGVIVFEYNGKLIQSNSVKYDGKSGFIEWEVPYGEN